MARKKIFEHKFFNIPKLERVTVDGKRYYRLPNGNLAISVTTAVSDASDKTALYEWKARVGEAAANRISTQAANRGTALHSICEHYLLNKEDYPENSMPSNIDMFKTLRPYLDKHITEIYGLETTLYSNELNAAGTTDCVALWDGIPSIIDFKTSRKEKKEEWIQGYFFQATIYAMMVEELTGVEIPKIVILVGVDDNPPQVFVKDKSQYIQRVREIFDERNKTGTTSETVEREARIA